MQFFFVYENYYKGGTPQWKIWPQYIIMLWIFSFYNVFLGSVSNLYKPFVKIINQATNQILDLECLVNQYGEGHFFLSKASPISRGWTSGAQPTPSCHASVTMHQQVQFDSVKRKNTCAFGTPVVTFLHLLIHINLYLFTRLEKVVWGFPWFFTQKQVRCSALGRRSYQLEASGQTASARLGAIWCVLYTSASQWKYTCQNKIQSRFIEAKNFILCETFECGSLRAEKRDLQLAAGKLKLFLLFF